MRLPSLTLALLLTACSSSSSTVKPDAPPVAEPGGGELPADAAPASERMALIVSFYSPGNGTNAEASAKLDALVEAFQPPPARKSVRWGREGEHDECFKLDDLSQEQRAAFIALVEQELGGADRVNLLKDEACREPW
jgi:hypothetical protein